MMRRLALSRQAVAAIEADVLGLEDEALLGAGFDAECRRGVLALQASFDGRGLRLPREPGVVSAMATAAGRLSGGRGVPDNVGVDAGNRRLRKQARLALASVSADLFTVARSPADERAAAVAAA
jgi:hypothetical protein